MNGYKSVHPQVGLLLQHLSVEDWMITQGIGYAKASAHSHEPVGTYQGRKVGHCIDLSISLATRMFVDRLAASGFAAWARVGERWAGNEHIHAVFAGCMRLDGGSCARRMALPEAQITDWIKSLNGLVGHEHLLPLWDPDPAQEAFLHAVRAAGSTVRPVLVRLGSKTLRCTAVSAIDVTRCELRPVVEALGKNVAAVVVNPPAGAGLKDEGSFTRCNLRPLVEGLGRKLSWADNGVDTAPIATIT